MSIAIFVFCKNTITPAARDNSLRTFCLFEFYLSAKIKIFFEGLYKWFMMKFKSQLNKLLKRKTGNIVWILLLKKINDKC